MTDKITISIEGNIGVGKSTFVALFQKYFNDLDVVDEPIDIWQNLKDDSGKNILQLFYDNNAKYAYLFQNTAYVTRMMMIENKIRETDKKYILVDRSIYSDKNIFEKLLHNSGDINELEHQIYNLWADFYQKYVRKNNKNLFVYLKCSVDTAHKRIMKRARKEEDGISREYLQKLNDCHDEWLLNNNTDDVIVIDCDIDFEHDAVYHQEIFAKIREKLKEF